MKLELTQRDILLLKLAGSVLILFVMVRFMIMPGIGRIQERSLEKQMLEDTVEEMKTAIDAVPLLEDAVSDRLGKLDMVSSAYYERMETHQVDELLTGLALEHDLFPVSLNMTEALPGIPQAYRYGTTAPAGEVLSETYIQTAVANMSLRGDQEAVFGFLDDIGENYPAVQVRSVHMNQRTYLSEDGAMVMQMDAGFVLWIYMCDKTAVE